MARQKRSAPSAAQTSPAAPAPSPAVAAGSVSSTDNLIPVGDAKQTGAVAPVVKVLETQVLADPPPGGQLEQLVTVDLSTGEVVPPAVGLEGLGALALDASAARIEARLAPIEDAALAGAHLQEGAPAIGSPDVDLPSGDPSDPGTLGLSDVDDEAEWAARYLRRMTQPGIPVLFREKGRRFNGSTTTPAIITRVLEDSSVNLMVLPDGDVPYPRMGVPYEATLDPEALGRAWSHLKIPDD